MFGKSTARMGSHAARLDFRLRSIEAELMPANATAIISKTQTVVNAGAALAALSSVSVEVAPSVAANFGLLLQIAPLLAQRVGARQTAF